MRLKRVYMEIINTCNLHCDFCIQNRRSPQYMTAEAFWKAAIQVKNVCDYVYLHVMGEPLMHPQLQEILKICEEIGLYVNLTSNGTLLKQQENVLAKAHIRQLNVSVHSFPAHQQKGYLDDMFSVCESMAKHGTHINYRLWSLQDQQLSNETEILLDAICEQYHCQIKKSEIHRLQRLDLADHIHLHFEEVFTWPSLSHPYVGDKGRCLGMKTMCGILCDGTVIPCCLDSMGDIALGNIFETPLVQILDSTRVKEMIRGFDAQCIKEELCQHCSYRLRFSKR